MNYGFGRKVVFEVALMLTPLILLSSFIKQELYKKHINITNSFSIHYPEKWEGKENYEQLAFIMFSPLISETDFFRENVNIVVQDVEEDVTLKSFYTLNKSYMSNSLVAFETHIEGETIVDDISSMYGVYTYNVQVVKIKSLAYVFVTMGKAYIITGSSTTTEFDNYFDIFKSISETIRFLN